MGYGGAPPWVYKKRAAILTSSYESQISTLEEKMKKLEEENTQLRKELDEANRKCKEYKHRLGE